MKGDQGVLLSEVKKALDVATEKMGKQMGTRYQVDDSLSASAVKLFKTKSDPDEAKLKEALGNLPGFTSVSVSKGGFSAVFKGEKVPRVNDVKTASKLEVVDVILGSSSSAK